VFDCGAPTPGFHVYVHSLRDRSDGKAVLAINLDREREQVLRLPVESTRVTLTAKELQARSVMLNGTPLQMAPDGSLPELVGETVPPGPQKLPPASISFLSIPAAD
jgi:hypothetical protein